MIRTAAFLFLAAMACFLALPARALPDGAVRLQPGACGGEVRGVVSRAVKTGEEGRNLPLGMKLVGRCNQVGNGAARSFVILWSSIETTVTLRAEDGAPFGTSVVPAACIAGDACTPSLPAREIPIRLRENMPPLCDGDAM